MIHYRECDRCTHQWKTCCFGDFMLEPKEREHHYRQSASGLCGDCFEQLETGEITGLEIFELYHYLSNKGNKYGASVTWKVFNEGTPKSPFYNHQKLSTMCHSYISATYNEDGSEKTPSNFEWGETAEHKQLREIESEIREIFHGAIKSQRTEKRIELDEFQKTSGFFLFCPRPRPEGFIGDPPGKVRYKALFGIDFSSGEFVTPKIITENGNGC